MHYLGGYDAWLKEREDNINGENNKKLQTDDKPPCNSKRYCFRSLLDKNYCIGCDYITAEL